MACVCVCTRLSLNAENNLADFITKLIASRSYHFKQMLQTTFPTVCSTLCVNIFIGLNIMWCFFAYVSFVVFCCCSFLSCLFLSISLNLNCNHDVIFLNSTTSIVLLIFHFQFDMLPSRSFRSFVILLFLYFSLYGIF